MEGSATFLEGHTIPEKEAYLGAIASIATADRKASTEETGYLSRLCLAAGLPAASELVVKKAMDDLPGKELTRFLDILKTSELRFPLIADLMVFAKADQHFSEEEEETIHRIGEYLGVDQHQFALLDQFTEKFPLVPMTTEQAGDPAFLFPHGLKNKLENEGIGVNSLLHGLMAVAALAIQTVPASGSLTGMLSGGRGLGQTRRLLERILGRGGR